MHHGCATLTMGGLLNKPQEVKHVNNRKEHLLTSRKAQ